MPIHNDVRKLIEDFHGAPIRAVQIGYRDWNSFCLGISHDPGQPIAVFQETMVELGPHADGLRVVRVRGH